MSSFFRSQKIVSLLKSLTGTAAVFVFLTASAGIVLLAACASGPQNIPENLSPAELIQRAQEASDKNRYSAALQYYEVLRERNTTNIDLVINAEYEIAFIHYKQKKYPQAKNELRTLMDHYTTADSELLPQKFRLLGQKVLEQIAEKEKPRLFFGIGKKTRK